MSADLTAICIVCVMPTTIVAVVSYFRYKTKQLQASSGGEADRKLLDGLRAGVSHVGALVKRIYVDVPEFLHAAAAMSVTAHLRRLERDGIVARDGEAWTLSE